MGFIMGFVLVLHVPGLEDQCRAASTTMAMHHNFFALLQESIHGTNGVTNHKMQVWVVLTRLIAKENQATMRVIDETICNEAQRDHRD
jgi:hypothetical protein